MKHLLTYLLTYLLPAAMLVTLAHRSAAQGSYLENTPADIRLIGGQGASVPDAVTHNFIVQRFLNNSWNYPRVMNISNSGRVGIADGIAYGSRSRLSVGLKTYSVSIDDAGSYRYSDKLVAYDYVRTGGACIGFNVGRQGDASYACESGPLDAASATSPNRNGGALIWSDVEGTLNFTAFPSNGGASGVDTHDNIQYFYASHVQAYRVMKIRASNQVQIGPSAPPLNTTHNDYRLAVDGKLVAKSVFVTQATANWADFVFAPTYALQPLPELEAYLKQNRHLPAIPSAAEVEKNGVDLGEMNAKLLQSLEELTLHVIELGKQNARLQAEVAALAARVDQAADASVVGK